MKDIVWSEKYRPKEMSDYIATEDFKENIKELTKNPIAMPHFLFTSRSPGTGKTSLAYVIQHEIGCPNSDVLVLNSSDDRKIETIRGRVKNFALTMRSKKGVPRLVIMDEFDGMLSASQDALRFIMEKYSSNCKFILTANDDTKIINPIKSRCIHMQLKDIDKLDIASKLTLVCVNEGLKEVGGEKGKVEYKAIEKIVDIHYPDIRRMINHLQELAPNITLDKIKTKTEHEQELFSILKSGKSYNARKYIIQNGLDPREVLRYILDETLKLTPDVANTRAEVMFKEEEFEKRRRQTIWEIAEADFRISMGADPDIQMFSFIKKFEEVWG